jgi:hypothetical protein
VRDRYSLKPEDAGAASGIAFVTAKRQLAGRAVVFRVARFHRLEEYPVFGAPEAEIIGGLQYGYILRQREIRTRSAHDGSYIVECFVTE